MLLLLLFFLLFPLLTCYYLVIIVCHCYFLSWHIVVSPSIKGSLRFSVCSDASIQKVPTSSGLNAIDWMSPTFSLGECSPRYPSYCTNTVSRVSFGHLDTRILSFFPHSTHPLAVNHVCTSDQGGTGRNIGDVLLIRMSTQSSRCRTMCCW